MAQSPSEKNRSYLKNLPDYLFKKIWQFLRSPMKFYLVDIGSVYGTYIRVKPNTPKTI